ncbi:MAG: hypothetical protein OEZ13_02025 [Spirochaetia bacterium]|nr:hypothetical protein [Spirochaetia bacterium]
MPNKSQIHILLISITSIIGSFSLFYANISDKNTVAVQKGKKTDPKPPTEQKINPYEESDNNSQEIELSNEDFFKYKNKQLYSKDKDLNLGKSYLDIFHPLEYKNKDVKLYIFGNMDMSTGFKYNYCDPCDQRSTATFDFDLAKNDKVVPHMKPTSMQVSVKGKLGKKINVNIDYNKDENKSENHFWIQYKTPKTSDFLQEITIGNIDLLFPKREFVVFEQSGKKTMGLESKMTRGKLNFHTIATLTQGESYTQTFIGNTKKTGKLINDHKFIRRKYYQLEPFTYYDRLTSAPIITAASYDRASGASLITLTSFTANPDTYMPNYDINIDPLSIEIYLDDRDSANDQFEGAQQKIISTGTGTDLGNFHLLKQGIDYICEFNTGRITFLKNINENYKIFVRYTHHNGSLTSTDPSARIDNGKIETFIKFGKTLHEDLNRNGILDAGEESIDDGKLNLDIYEVRGVYNLGASEILESSFTMTLVKKDLNPENELNDLGRKDINYETGIISFNLREPFKNAINSSGEFLLSDENAGVIYNESTFDYIADYSILSFRTEFSSIIHSYQLTHSNLIKNSEKVKVNAQVIASKLYYIDYKSGFFQFLDPHNPQIGSQDTIEISYEYLPFGSSSNGYILGLRTDYKATKYVNIGGTILYNGEFENAEAPQIGEAPASKLVFEGDIDVKIDEEKVTRLINTIPGIDLDLLPIQIEGYAEYAKSIYNPNTFGYALIDDMESSEESNEVPISEKDWVLSAIPPSLTGALECDRSPLYYHFYRDPEDYSKGLLDFATGPTASPAYSSLSGPYNVSDGHLDSSQLNSSQAEKQVSLVLDFDFSKTTTSNQKFASINTREFSTVGEDFSNVTYLEFYAKLKDAVNVNSGIRIAFDLGTLNEDTDSDGFFDTEDIGLDLINGDTNGNNIKDPGETWDTTERDLKLSQDQSIGLNEDIGYSFNPPGCPSANTIVGAGPNISSDPLTKGNGILNQEDFDKDGKFSLIENSVPIDSEGSVPYLYFEQTYKNILSTNNWQLFRVYLNQAEMSDKQKLALREVKSIRLYIVPHSDSTNASGKILIDSIKFAGTKWRKTYTEDFGSSTRNSNYDTTVFRSASINNFTSKIEYEPNSFLKEERDEWELLHGKKTNTEHAYIREGALKLTYNLNSTNEKAYAERIFIKAMELQHYKTINLWVNFRTPEITGHSFLFRVGSSENDYYEYEFPINSSGWQKLSFDLKNPEREYGNFNMLKTNIMAVGVKKPDSSLQLLEGTIWVNDIFTSDPISEDANAYKYESTIKITKPIYKTESGVEIISDFKATFKKIHKDRYFNSIGISEKFKDIETDDKSWNIESNLLPFWKANYLYENNKTNALPEDFQEEMSFDGFTKTITHNTTHTIKFKPAWYPVINTGFLFSRVENDLEETFGNSFLNIRQLTNKIKKNNAPTFSIKHKIPKFLSTQIEYDLENKFNLLSEIETGSLKEENLLSPNKDNRQKELTEETKNNLKIKIGEFLIEPVYSHKRVRLLEKNYTDDSNINMINGSFYIPIIESPKDFRFRERMTKYELKTEYKKLWIFSPKIKTAINYKESSFTDNLSTFDRDKFQRLKQPSTLTSLEMSIPVEMKNNWFLLNIFKKIKPAFYREINLVEKNMPFTNMTDLYKDEFGFNRTLPPLMNNTFNLYEYPFWRFFYSDSTRKNNNYSNGRDYVYKTQYIPDIPPEYSDSLLIYNNSLSLKEKISGLITWDIWKPLTLRTDINLSQEINRPTVDALPTQKATWGFFIEQKYDFMKIFNFWFWSQKKKRQSNFEFNFKYERNMYITLNQKEDKYTPETSILFSWFNKDNASTSISVTFGLNLRIFNHKEYISDENEDDAVIYLQIPSLPELGIKEKDTGYDFKITYKTELPSLKKYFNDITSLNIKYHPAYTLDFLIDLNKANYNLPEKKIGDLTNAYSVKQSLSANLHANVSGKISFEYKYNIIKQIQGTVIEKKKTILFDIGIKILF